MSLSTLRVTDFRDFFEEEVAHSWAHCTVCNVKVPITNLSADQTNEAMHSHVRSRQHKQMIKQSDLPKDQKENLLRFCNAKQPKEVFEKVETHIIECIFVYHTIKHHLSFRSMNCTNALMRRLGLDHNFRCGERKTKLIITKVLAPYADKKLIAQLERARFVTVMHDSTTYKKTKVLAILVRFYDVNDGVVIRIIDLMDITEEKAPDIVGYINKAIRRVYLDRDKIISVMMDNASVNVGNKDHGGDGNVLSIMNREFTHDLIGIGCIAHILNNTIKNALLKLKKSFGIDIGAIINNVYAYLGRDPKRIKTVEAVWNEYQRSEDWEPIELPKNYIDTRWLSLVPALKVLIKHFDAYQLYFRLEAIAYNIKKDNKRRKSFKEQDDIATDATVIKIHEYFENETTLYWLKTIYPLAKRFYDASMELQGKTVALMSGIVVVEDILDICKNNQSRTFIPSDVLPSVNKLSSSLCNEFKLNVNNFYANCCTYLTDWTKFVNEYKVFEWASLRTEIDLNQVNETIKLINRKGIKIADLSEIQLSNEIKLIQSFVLSNLRIWNGTPNASTETRWKRVFEKFPQYSNLQTIISLILSIAATNATTEGVFSELQYTWPDGRPMEFETVRALMMTNKNLDKTCVEFVDEVESDAELQRGVSSNDKYIEDEQDRKIKKLKRILGPNISLINQSPDKSANELLPTLSPRNRSIAITPITTSRTLSNLNLHSTPKVSCEEDIIEQSDDSDDSLENSLSNFLSVKKRNSVMNKQSKVPISALTTTIEKSSSNEPHSKATPTKLAKSLISPRKRFLF